MVITSFLKRILFYLLVQQVQGYQVGGVSGYSGSFMLSLSNSSFCTEHNCPRRRFHIQESDLRMLCI